MQNLLSIIDESSSSCLQSFTGIAEKLMNNYKLQVRDTFYRIVECEFYYSSAKHEYPFVHGHKRQKETFGEWYFHGSGLDITLADGKGYGGILIRGIAKLKEGGKVERGDEILGPLNVCTEIFNKIGSVMADKPVEFGLRDISQDSQGASMPTARVFAVPRIGLNSEKDHTLEFCTQPYRFISFLHLPHRESEKIKNYLINKTKELTREEYKGFASGENS